jgi:hypothetical protein
MDYARVGLETGQAGMLSEYEAPMIGPAVSWLGRSHNGSRR